MAASISTRRPTPIRRRCFGLPATRVRSSLLPDLKSLQQRFIAIEIEAEPSRALSRACGSSTSFSPRQAAVLVLTQVIVAL